VDVPRVPAEASVVREAVLREPRLQVPFDLARTLEIRVAEPNSGPARLVDVSRAGLRLVSAATPRVGQTLTLALPGPGDATTTVGAIVRWWQGAPYGAGEGGLRIASASIDAWRGWLEARVAPHVDFPGVLLRHLSPDAAQPVIVVGPDPALLERIAGRLRAGGYHPQACGQWSEAEPYAADAVVIAGPYAAAAEAERFLGFLQQRGLASPPLVLVALPGAEPGARRALIEAGAFDCVPTLEGEELELRLLVALRSLRQRRGLRDEVERLSDLSGRDPLTGLVNRRRFFDIAGAERSRARRSGERLALMLLDIDHFKRVNDLYGHQVGDRLLCRFARVLEAHLRPFDVVGRYGGEEFVALLPGADTPGALTAAERLRAAVAATDFDDQGIIRLTMSAGVVAADPPEIPPVSALVASADRALYRAKHGGRNRVTLGILEHPRSPKGAALGV
jgi:diguanylate cyclase (GGDEF)-like protein